jgi:hypothetical protein
VTDITIGDVGGVGRIEHRRTRAGGWGTGEGAEHLDGEVTLVLVTLNRSPISPLLLFAGVPPVDTTETDPAVTPSTSLVFTGKFDAVTLS